MPLQTLRIFRDSAVYSACKHCTAKVMLPLQFWVYLFGCQSQPGILCSISQRQHTPFHIHWRCCTHRRTYENTELLLTCIQYTKYNWNIYADLEVATLLLKMQFRYISSTVVIVTVDLSGTDCPYNCRLLWGFYRCGAVPSEI